MPFDNHGSRSFTAISVGKNAPSASGVYGLSDARRWIYVGQTGNIQAELLKHLQNPDALAGHRPSGFTFELCAPEHRLGRQSRLVWELAPIANSRVE